MTLFMDAVQTSDDSLEGGQVLLPRRFLLEMKDLKYIENERILSICHFNRSKATNVFQNKQNEFSNHKDKRKDLVITPLYNFSTVRNHIHY